VRSIGFIHIFFHKFKNHIIKPNEYIFKLIEIAGLGRKPILPIQVISAIEHLAGTKNIISLSAQRQRRFKIM
jgi:hypothetical protein